MNGMDFFGGFLGLSGGYVVVLGLVKSSPPEVFAVAFCLFVAAAATLWMNGIPTIPIEPPDDWDKPKGD